VDIAVPVHTPVLATAGGLVAAAESDPVYGHYVVVAHGGGIETMYGHNAVLLVETGERVTRGQPIAYSGNSGRSTAPHLHYEIRRAGRAIDPAPYLR
jgi:murein DD-endopeptidase MepM/ murein hydrolase activator NlpD